MCRKREGGGVEHIWLVGFHVDEAVNKKKSYMKP